MSNIRPTEPPSRRTTETAIARTTVVQTLAQSTLAQTGPGIPDEARGPLEDPDFELELERAERRLRWTREHPLFGIHPDGLGPTLGQNLSQPNPGHDVDWNDQGYDPPT